MILTGAHLHHVGFVVDDVERSIEGFQRSLQAEWDGQIWDDPLQRVKIAFLKVGGSPVQLELVAPLGGDSPVIQFLQRGGGLHHLCYEAADFDQYVAHMHSLGNLMVRAPVPAVAFGNRRIAWLMTREKLLIEVLETRA